MGGQEHLLHPATSDVSSARAMLSDPPDRATAILCERETPRSPRVEAKRCSKPEQHRLKPVTACTEVADTGADM